LLDRLIWGYLDIQVEEALTHSKWIKVDASKALAFVEVEEAACPPGY
jgi:hypothetical protein